MGEEEDEGMRVKIVSKNALFFGTGSSMWENGVGPFLTSFFSHCVHVILLP